MSVKGTQRLAPPDRHGKPFPFEQLPATEFPDSGFPFHFKFDCSLALETHNWCVANCVEEWDLMNLNVKYRGICMIASFVSKRDAAMFKLFFCR